MKYDSERDTKKHIAQVRFQLQYILDNLSDRAYKHDDSKLREHEKPTFDEFSPKLKDSTYGSDEYKQFLKEMFPALKHHYENNSHHPEHYENGINGMSLLDLVEMLADWKAATLRHADGNILESLKINRERFNMSDQLYEIFVNTIKEMKW